METGVEIKKAEELMTILSCPCTATELAEWYLRERPSGSINASVRDEISKTLSVFDAIDGKPGLIHEISEAYCYFTEYILYEADFFVNNKIHEMLLSLDQVADNIEKSEKTLELIYSMPVSVNPKAELMAREQFICNTREPLYLKSSQLTNLQMFCLRNPEYLDEVVCIMAQRPFVRDVNENDKPYLQAFAKVVYELITNSIPLTHIENGMTQPTLNALIAGVLNAFYNEYLSFPSDEYLMDLVSNSVDKTEE